ncbi:MULTISPECIES: cytochrome b [unclassified Methylophilus]|jgi:cytochrome b561|uniref:cytochrome b n=1 Tax=unclassified Methylophilus TaxID=2630143 RepID=UPI00188F1F45|nr:MULTISPECIES: cytochrome b [unclassified Methylophilus]MBF5040648.1 cytochrome b [Methylophilus sp. 13]MDF0377917.1 cytochrome b [Methylophilus sp. YYY-1]MDT7849279.1 cytochrome b [Methylophilus sp. VKM B-3414]
MSSTQRYTKVAIILHWLIALVIIGMFALGWYMGELPKDGPKQTAFDLFDLGIVTWQMDEPATARTLYFNLHKSIGFTLLWLVIFRVYWRVTHTPPAMLASYSALERKLATAVHHMLYLLMVLIPLSGVLMTLYSKFGLKWFGLEVFGGLDNADLRDVFKESHELFANLMLAAFIVHVLGALKHQWKDKDETMSRMSLK